MQKSNKALVIIFIIILLVVIGEVIYYFFFLSPKKNRQDIIPTQNKRLTETFKTTPSQNTSSPSPFQSKVDPTMMRYLTNLGYDALQSSTMTNIIQGKLSAFEIIDDNSKDYKIMLDVTADTGQTVPVRYRQFGFNKIKAFQKINDETTPFQINGLKSGDIISIKETRDLTKKYEESIVDIVITKL